MSQDTIKKRRFDRDEATDHDDTTGGSRGDHDSDAPAQHGSVVRLARLWTPPTPHEHARERLLALLVDDPLASRDRDPQPWSWWQVRHQLGGVVDTEAFRALVGELLAEGGCLTWWRRPATAGSRAIYSC